LSVKSNLSLLRFSFSTLCDGFKRKKSTQKHFRDSIVSMRSRSQTKHIVLHAFSRALCRSRVLSLGSDWFIGFCVCCDWPVDFVGFDFTTLSRRPLHYIDKSVLVENTRKVHTKLHPGVDWCIFHILTTEDIDDVISGIYAVVCAKILFVYIMKRKLRSGLKI